MSGLVILGLVGVGVGFLFFFGMVVRVALSLAGRVFKKTDTRQ